MILRPKETENIPKFVIDFAILQYKDTRYGDLQKGKSGPAKVRNTFKISLFSGGIESKIVF